MSKSQMHIVIQVLFGSCPAYQCYQVELEETGNSKLTERAPDTLSLLKLLHKEGKAILGCYLIMCC